MRLANPFFLLLFVPLAAAIYFYLRNKIGQEASLRFSSLDLVRASGVRHFSPRRILVALLRTAAIAALIIGLARPQTGQGQTKETRFVVDIMLALDTSSSMATLDFQPANRLEAAKLAAKKFIESRPDDRLGLIVFAKNGITQCPLTTDKTALLALVDRVQMGMLEDGTAIGVGLAMAVNRLKDSEAKSKVAILLTDGVNNSGEVDPKTAAKIAKTFGVRVYTIGMGVEGEALLPINDPRLGTRLVRVQTQIDDALMTEIAESTGGKYYRAKDEKALNDVFTEINRLEKTEIKVDEFTRYDDHYENFIWAGLFIFLLELFVTNLLIRRIP